MGGAASKWTSGQQGGGWTSGGGVGGVFNGGPGGGSGDIENKLGFGTKKQDEDAGKMSANAGQMYQDTQGVLSGMKGAQDKYSGDMDNYYTDYQTKMAPVIGKWQKKNDDLMGESEQQGKDAHAAYTNTILPQMKNNMESAMTLKQAMDPNNSVAAGVRKQYDDAATGETNRGVANYGVLAGLGAQATQNAAGAGGPMTGGQMQALQGANMSQAGTAFANAQAYAQKLRDQGMERGQNQSNWAYNAGQQAGQDYQGAVGNDANMQQGFRGEQNDLSGEGFQMGSMMPTQNFNYNQGQASSKLGFANQQGNSQIAAIGQKYGVQNAALGMQANAAGAQQAGKMGIYAAGLGAAGNYFGGKGGKGGGGGGLGGVGGAAAGAMGGAAGGGGAPGGDAAGGGQGNVNGGGRDEGPADGSEDGAPQQGYQQDSAGGNNNSTGGMAITDPNNGQGYRPYNYGGGVYSQMGGNGYQNRRQAPSSYYR